MTQLVSRTHLLKKRQSFNRECFPVQRDRPALLVSQPIDLVARLTTTRTHLLTSGLNTRIVVELLVRKCLAAALSSSHSRSPSRAMSLSHPSVTQSALYVRKDNGTALPLSLSLSRPNGHLVPTAVHVLRQTVSTRLADPPSLPPSLPPLFPELLGPDGSDICLLIQQHPGRWAASFDLSLPFLWVRSVYIFEFYFQQSPWCKPFSISSPF